MLLWRCGLSKMIGFDIYSNNMYSIMHVWLNNYTMVCTQKNEILPFSVCSGFNHFYTQPSSFLSLSLHEQNKPSLFTPKYIYDTLPDPHCFITLSAKMKPRIPATSWSRKITVKQTQNCQEEEGMRRGKRERQIEMATTLWQQICYGLML